MRKADAAYRHAARDQDKPQAAVVWKEWLIPPILFPPLLAAVFIVYMLLRTAD